MASLKDLNTKAAQRALTTYLKHNKLRKIKKQEYLFFDLETAVKDETQLLKEKNERHIPRKDKR